MNKFDEWMKKIFGRAEDVEQIKETATPEAKLDEEEIKDEETEKDKIETEFSIKVFSNSEKMRDYSDFNTMRRNLLINKALDQVNKYDITKKEKDPEYKTYKEGLELEVAEDDKNEAVDVIMDIELQKKLEVYNKPEIITDERREEVKKQEIVYNQRKKERDETLKSSMDFIKTYDEKMRQTNPDYKDFGEESDEDAKKLPAYINDEMDILLQEKLGVYNEECETADVQTRRMAQRKAAEERLKEHNKQRDEIFNSRLNKMNKYDEKLKKNDPNCLEFYL